MERNPRPRRPDLPKSGLARATRRGRLSFSTATFSTSSAFPCAGSPRLKNLLHCSATDAALSTCFGRASYWSSRKSAGRDLAKAKTQALSYFPGLKDADLPRYILLSDFATFELYDLDEDESVAFALADLPQHVEKFGFILGVQKRTFRDQDPVNIKASERVGDLHDALAASGYTGHDLEQFLVRIVFCFFADDTGIFEPRDIFLDLLESRTREDGSDLGGWLAQLFQVLNTPEDRRAQTLDEDLARFPYVNGDLFRDPLLIPSFDSAMRQRLIDACHFNWSDISPAIFGSLFQSVMDKDEHRAQGAHYTTEQNILKVIEPLFLDELRAEFRRLQSRRDNRRHSRTHLPFSSGSASCAFLIRPVAAATFSSSPTASCEPWKSRCSKRFARTASLTF